MPSLPPLTMSMPQLFTHTYDIDDIIVALCTTPPAENTWLLNTLEGKITATPTAQVPTGPHFFTLTPLPNSFLQSLNTHPQRHKLSNEHNDHLTQLLSQIHSPADLLPHLDHTPAGGWLRERTKEAALEWLDTYNLIPPSMRHVKALSPAFIPQPIKSKVTIS